MIMSILKKMMEQTMNSQEKIKKTGSLELKEILSSLKEKGDAGLDRLFISLRKMERDGRIKESISALRTALKIFPKDRYLKFHLSILNYREGKYSKAEQDLKELTQDSESSVDHSLLLGKSLIMQGKYQEALNIISSIYNHEDDELNNIYGVLLFKNGDIKRAKEMFNQAISINPDNYFAYNNLSIHYFMDENYDLAKKYLKISEKLSGSNDIVHKNSESLFYNPESENGTSIREEALGLYFKGKYDDAAKAYQRLIADNIDNEKEFNNLGCCYYKLNDFENAEKTFRNSLLASKNDFALINLLKTCNKLGTLDFQFDEIKSSFGIEISPDVKKKIIIDTIISPDELKVYTETIKEQVLLLFSDGKAPVVINKSFIRSDEHEEDAFPEIAGMKSVKKILSEEIIAVLENPKRFSDYGISIPNGILLYGPPGCGKTYISTKLSKKLNLKMYTISASDVGSIYIHGTSMKIDDVIKSAKWNAPSILFIDEIDSLFQKRSSLSGKDAHKFEEIGQFLASINNISKHKVILIATTNAPGVIDEALLRPGRIDKLVYVGPPDMEAREDLLKIEMKKRKKAGEIDLKLISEMLSGYSCSDIVFIVEEAAKEAMKADEMISTKNFISVIRRNPPSIEIEMVKKYLAFKSRGM